ncbi:penicillin-binding protein 2 [Flavobacteriaceae bacterium]|jgi:cell division protein FtsI (penicillin-binding protein 3)|nr:penicillin-binding protein 2 [Flavobacteriaceae bacterium]
MEKKLKQIMYRSYLLVFSLFIFSILLIGKLIHLQFSQGEKYRELASKRTLKNDILQPSMGNIYADDGSIMATSVARYEIRWDAAVPSKTIYQSNKNDLAKGLAAIINGDEDLILRNLDKAVSKKNRYLLIAKGLSYSEQKRVKKLPIFKLSSNKGGVIIEQQIFREHPLGKIAERTIGYEIQDKEGKFIRVGLEGAFGQYLKGEEGRRLKQKIAGGQWKPINDNNEKEPTEGFDIHTTINVNIQDIAHTALLEQLEKFEADHGCVVVIETSTGKVKAIANLGRTEVGTYYEKLNYALGEAHEPGSTFKLVSMIAALEDKVIDENTPIKTGNGELNFYGKYKVRDSKKGGYGTIPAGKVFEVSSNTGIVKIIHDNYKNNPKKFVDRLYNMGINKPIGLPIKGEGKPKIPYPNDSDWDGLDLPWMAYGYGVAMTPLQTLTFYNAIANNGEMVKPRFIEKIGVIGESPHQIFGKEILNPSICSQSTIEKVKNMMFNVVDKEWGTAHNIKDKDFTIAGKTGTCQVDYNRIGKEVQYISSFVGYFPVKQPEYSCVVVIHRPNKLLGYYGSTVAAPVFKKIAKKIYTATPKKVHVGLDQLKSLSPEIVENKHKHF